MSKQKYPFEPDYAVAPGETLRETMDELGMSQVALAYWSGMAPETIKAVLDGTEPITPMVAIRLSIATGMPIRMWLNLEANYRRDLARAKGAI